MYWLCVWVNGEKQSCVPTDEAAGCALRKPDQGQKHCQLGIALTFSLLIEAMTEL